MSAVKRRQAPNPLLEIRPSRNQDFKRHWTLLSRPRLSLSRSTWLPDGPRSARHAHREPVYVSFVSKAILWDREPCHHTAHNRPHHPPLLCPRFLSHMEAHPEDLRPPPFLSSKSRPLPLSQGRRPVTKTLTAQTLEGNFQVSHRRRPLVQNQVTGRQTAVVVPSIQLPCSSPSSTINPSPPHQKIYHPVSRKPIASLAFPPFLHPALEDKDEAQDREEAPQPALEDKDEAQDREEAPQPALEDKDEAQDREEAPQPALVSIAKSDMMLQLGPAEPDRSPSPASVVSHGSLSDFSRPHSSLFSRSTNLASGRSSVLSEIIRDSDLEGSACVSPLHPPVIKSPSAGSKSHRSSMKTMASPPFNKPLSDQVRSISSYPESECKPPSRCGSTTKTENHHQAASKELALNPHPDSDPGLVMFAFPSTTWSSCPSPQRTTSARPRSASGPKLTPPASVTRPECQHWPVLPPISPIRGRCDTAASRYSELSCSQSHVFDELEAIAPQSTSCLSLDESDDSSCPSPDTELSPGLAALTVGCDSGNLGSISRVQLLLLNRNEPETLPSPFGYEDDLFQVEDWAEERMQDDPELTSAGVSRPLTAGSDSERCDSAGKVQENKSDQSEEGSGSPSSWIIDPSPSNNMFRSADSPRSSGDEEEEEADYRGWRDQTESPTGGRRPDHGEEEERKTKALSMLSKLQDDSRHQEKSSKGRSNFDDFDFLAKYCIFSQEKLAEYKRAFEAEDADGDGYISCLQVLLALKNILPAELLSEEEEIYVYRILEMVDFRVTDGLVDLRLFAVIASLAQKIASMDEFMRSLISDMDFRSLEVRLFKAKQLFLFLLEEQRGDGASQPGFISAEQLLLELKAGGIQLEQEAAVRLELQHIPPLDLLDFLAYLPLFMLIHKSVISNPLDSSSNI
ncbi:uncharacterized protein LOC121505638 [Cheilinus undulatus]|uniref:uncharacterized protein LOC121505638 n=1 Tax=Cheilinus undulatus TaxID=241271 RepID=UPI001BD3C5D0|nr:uncharacterized protein LOC121505638 [Cheilinus undulatus]